LRPARDDDEDLLTAIRNDLGIQEMLLSRARPNTPARVREWINRMGSDPATVFFVIGEAQSGSAVGFIQATGLDFIDGYGTLGVAVHPDFVRRGHARAAIQLLGSYLHAVFGLRKLVLQVRADHEPAIALYRSLGFREVGVWKDHHRVGDRYVDVLGMEACIVP
jgi:RimJ/RimL family protein N-acetyltransferase